MAGTGSDSHGVVGGIIRPLVEQIQCRVDTVNVAVSTGEPDDEDLVEPTTYSPHLHRNHRLHHPTLESG